MSYFDIFNELEICTSDGQLRLDYEEQFEGITLGDRLRKVLLSEEFGVEYPEAWYSIHSEKYQNEFIFKLFQHIAIGGGICQYETNIGEYLSVVKELYKDLVSVAKDPDTKEIKCFSHAFRIETINGYENKLYSGKQEAHP